MDFMQVLLFIIFRAADDKLEPSNTAGYLCDW